MCTGWFCREQGSCDKVKSSGAFFVGESGWERN